MQSKVFLIILILSLGIAFSSMYIILDKYSEMQINESQNSFELGYNSGIADSINAILEETDNCNIASISVNNFTRDVIDLSCLSFEEDLP